MKLDLELELLDVHTKGRIVLGESVHTIEQLHQVPLVMLVQACMRVVIGRMAASPDDIPGTEIVAVDCAEN